MTQNLYENETVQSQAQKLGFLESESGTIGFEKQYLESIRTIEPNKLKEISQEFITANKLSFIQASIIKYICRFDKKNGKEDIDKVIHYRKVLPDYLGFYTRVL